LRILQVVLGHSKTPKNILDALLIDVELVIGHFVQESLLKLFVILAELFVLLFNPIKHGIDKPRVGLAIYRAIPESSKGDITELFLGLIKLLFVECITDRKGFEFFMMAGFSYPDNFPS
jgi:hypothetical protein